MLDCRREKFVQKDKSIVALQENYVKVWRKLHGFMIVH